MARRYLWLDLETTSLHAETGHVLELGMVVTDPELVELDRYRCVFGYSPEFLAGRMDPKVEEMHQASGLLDEVIRAPTNRDVTWPAAYCWVQDMLYGHEAYLAGSGIHFDHRWLKVHYPRLLTPLHYRLLDVRSFTVAFPDLMPEQSRKHRAMDDIEDSIAVLRRMTTLLRG